MSDTTGETAPTQPYPAPAAPYVPRPPRRPLPGWGWGLIIAGTAIVALLIGGGFGFGAGLIASHIGQVRTSVVHPGSGFGSGSGFGPGSGFGGGMPGSGSGSHTGKNRFGGGTATPAHPGSPIPSPSATPNS